MGTNYVMCMVSLSKKKRFKQERETSRATIDADWRGTFLRTPDFVIRDPRLVASIGAYLRTHPTKDGKPNTK